MVSNTYIHSQVIDTGSITLTGKLAGWEIKTENFVYQITISKK
jgi:hypothetical protein